MLLKAIVGKKKCGSFQIVWGGRQEKTQRHEDESAPDSDDQHHWQEQDLPDGFSDQADHWQDSWRHWQERELEDGFSDQDDHWQDSWRRQTPTRRPKGGWRGNGNSLPSLPYVWFLSIPFHASLHASSALLSRTDTQSSPFAHSLIVPV